MSNLSRLTIVILTYERPLYILRNMYYWSGTDVTVHVLDGSKEPINTHELSIIGENVNYYHWPISPNQRIAKAISLVDTEFVTLLADDEFFLPSGLKECIKEIEENDLVACLGRCLFFNIDDGHVKAYPWEPPHTAFEDYQILSDSPRDRVLKHMNPYLCTTIYGVTKVDVWKKNLAVIGPECNSYDASELAYEMACAYQGKSKVINTLTWLRSDENPPIYSTPGSDDYHKLTAHKWYCDPKYQDEHEVFFSSIVNALSDGNQQKQAEIRQIVVEGMEEYVKCSKKTEKENRSLIIRFHRGLYQVLPERVIKLLRYMKHSFIKPPPDDYDLTLVEMAEYWKRSGISSNIKEVTDLQNIISDFHLHKNCNTK